MFDLLKNFHLASGSASDGEKFAAPPWPIPRRCGTLPGMANPSRKSPRIPRVDAIRIVAAAAALAICCGCFPSSSERQQDWEAWDVYLLQDQRIGYGHTSESRGVEQGRPVVRTQTLNHMAIKRSGQTTVQEIVAQSVETPDGRLIRFDCEMRMGQNPIRTTGQVRNGRLELETHGPTSSRDSIAWPVDAGGPIAVEQSLRRCPMLPGGRREVKTLMVGFNQPAVVELVAKKYEPVELSSGVHDLLRIETTTRMADGQVIEGVVWTDRTGESLKTACSTMNMETRRATKAEALEMGDVAELDLLPSMIVRIDPPKVDLHRAKRARYRVTLDDGDPAAALATGPSQSVRSLDAHTAEVTVHAIRPGLSDGNPTAPAEKPTDDDLRPNSYIESDDPQIVAEAQKVAGEETDPWRVALALERYVHREIKQKNFSQAFSTAAETLRSREGDCTEHAVLLAALCRARGIPARVAIGLVYMQGQAAFGYHMWTEVFSDGRWIPLDGTLALGGIGAGHLKIGQSNLHGATAHGAFLPVVQLIGRLKISAAD